MAPGGSFLISLAGLSGFMTTPLFFFLGIFPTLVIDGPAQALDIEGSAEEGSEAAIKLNLMEYASDSLSTSSNAVSLQSGSTSATDS